jgi:hypothetical protein
LEIAQTEAALSADHVSVSEANKTAYEAAKVALNTIHCSARIRVTSRSQYMGRITQELDDMSLALSWPVGYGVLYAYRHTFSA